MTAGGQGNESSPDATNSLLGLDVMGTLKIFSSFFYQCHFMTSRDDREKKKEATSDVDVSLCVWMCESGCI